MISKSYIPGKGWVPAVKAGKKALRSAKGAHAKTKGVSASDESFRSMLQRTDDISMTGSQKVGEIKVGRGRSASVHEAPSTGHAEAYAYMRGRDRKMVVKPGADPRVVSHEAAHLSPKKRTPYRLGQIQRDPAKAMREEARADMAGGFNYRDPEARKPDLSRFYSGYANAAANPKGASTQRRRGRAIDAQQAAAARFLGEQKVGSRSKMFNQRSLGEYRDVQDRISAGRGVNYKRSTRQMNSRNRAEDAARTTAPIAIAGGAAGYGIYGSRKQKEVTKSMGIEAEIPQAEGSKEPVYTRARDESGRFIGTLHMGNSLPTSMVEGRREVSKALFKPKLPKPPTVPKPKVPTSPKGLVPRPSVPQTTSLTAKAPRIRETGISKVYSEVRRATPQEVAGYNAYNRRGLRRLVKRPVTGGYLHRSDESPHTSFIKRPNDYGPSKQVKQFSLKADPLKVSKMAERGELVARQIPRDKQLRSTRVRKMSPDPSELHVMGAPQAVSARRAAAQRAARTRKLRYLTPTRMDQAPGR